MVLHYLFYLLAYWFGYLCVTADGQSHYHIKILECIAGCSFTITLEVVIANTLLSLFVRNLHFSMMSKGGRLE